MCKESKNHVVLSACVIFYIHGHTGVDEIYTIHPCILIKRYFFYLREKALIVLSCFLLHVHISLYCKYYLDINA